MSDKLMTERERNNMTTMSGHGFTAIVYFVTFLGETIVGRRSILYTLIVAVLAFAPVLAEGYYWKKDRENEMIKHLVAIGFAILYTFVMFTTTNGIIYVYGIPMVLVVSVYNDEIYALKVNIGMVIENIIIVVIGAMTGGMGYRDAGSAMVQVMVTILIAFYAYYVARTSKKNHEQKMMKILEAQRDTEAAKNGIEELSEKMRTGIGDIYTRVTSLSQSSENTKNAMAQVTDGATDTADAVQRQLEQTEAIQQKAAQVESAAAEIRENMQHTLEVLENGNRDIEVLVGEVEASVEKGADVAEKLEDLDGYITQMNSIVELIGGITSQTSLLALNASIEAARAGEAGKGFAVVATEISGMATQTKDATVHITELIENVSSAITTVVAMIREMIKGINEEKISTENTADSFGKIQQNTFAIRDNLEKLTTDIDEMDKANREVAESVQTISAVSQEVSAHANETLIAEEDNMENLQIITQLTTELINLAKRN